MAATLYDRLGGDAAISTALDAFYVKVLADPTLKEFFSDVNVEAVKKQQCAFLAMAFGGPADYHGRDMRAAHASTVAQGLDTQRFDRFMGHFRDTLAELGVGGDAIEEVMSIAYGAKDEVLNR